MTGNPVLRTLLAHANKMPTFMPETGAFKDNIKADSEVPTRAKKARKSGVFKDSIKHKESQRKMPSALLLSTRCGFDSRMGRCGMISRNREIIPFFIGNV